MSQTVQRSQNIIAFLKFCGKLKHLLRTGWVNSSVKAPETVASHMYRMGIISMLVPDQGYNRERCIKMSIVHDIAESIVGDITPDDNVNDDDKYSQERAAMEKFKNILLEGLDFSIPENQYFKEHVQEMIDLWQEYEDLKTPEALLVKDIDRFDMILQATEYEQDQTMVLQSFFDTTRGKFKTQFVQDLVQELYKQRTEYQK
jgi:putative hydrolase of HD superfamily